MGNAATSTVCSVSYCAVNNTGSAAARFRDSEALRPSLDAVYTLERDLDFVQHTYMYCHQMSQRTTVSWRVDHERRRVILTYI